MSALSKQFSYPIIHARAAARCFRASLWRDTNRSARAEELRSIRSSLVSAAVSKGVRAFAMMGSRPGMGSTYFAGNLAIAFAQMSVATLLVDANLRDPRIAEMFGAERSARAFRKRFCTERSTSLRSLATSCPGSPF